jgi:hypothetical protein
VENKFVAVLDKVEKVERALKQLKAYINDQHVPVDVPKAIETAFNIEDMLFEVTEGLQDLEMESVDFTGINLDQAFENNPVSDYVQAGIDYVSGDLSALGRMMDAAKRITDFSLDNEKEEAADVLQRVTEREEENAKQLSYQLSRIEEVLQGTDIDNWSEEQVELARFFLQFQPDNTLNEVELLTPHGVKLVWKRRRYLGATK